MPSLGSIFTGFLQIVGLLDWAKQVLHDHSVQQTQQTVDKLVDSSATIQEAAHIEAVRNEVQNLTHAELIDQYARLQARATASHYSG